MKHYIWLLYEPAIDPDKIEQYFPISLIIRVLREGKGKTGCIGYYCPMCLSRIRIELKFQHHFRHCKRQGHQSLEAVSSDNAILRFKCFQNSTLRSGKLELDIEAKLMDVYDSSYSNHVKEQKAIVVSYGHAQRESSHTNKYVELFETLGGKTV